MGDVPLDPDPLMSFDNQSSGSFDLWRLTTKQLKEISYRGASLIEKRPTLGPYKRPLDAEGPMVALGGGYFLMGEVSL